MLEDLWVLTQLNISPQGYLIISLLVLGFSVVFILVSIKNVISANSIVGWWRAYLPKGLTLLLLAIIVMLIGSLIIANSILSKNMDLDKNDILTIGIIILLSTMLIYLSTSEIRKSLEYLLPRE